MKKNLLLLGLLLCSSFSILIAQTTVTGKVVDPTTGEGLPGANVYIDGTTEGTTTNLDGSYSFSTDLTGSQTLISQFIGFDPLSQTVNLNGGTVEVPTSELAPSAIGLKQFNVVADVAIDRKTPVAVSKIPTKQIQERIGNTEFTEIMRTTPSIYTTRAGGGFGDSRINIRGFAQENVALLINGIPVNGMEDNKIYWSNWAGLGDVTRTIQIQRGLGASKLAVASVGGTINIITKTTDQAKGGMVSTSIGNNGYAKTQLTLSTGRTEDGWAVTFSGSRTTGDGWVEGTYIDAWNYFLSVSKEINENHMLLLTGFGAPQRHGQRDFEHPIDDQEDTYGIRWNDDFGYYQGQPFLFRENFYHKPQFGLSHLWQISDNTNLTTSAYASIGRGGGTGDIGGINGASREFRQPKDEYGHQQFDQFALYNSGQPNTIAGDGLAALQYRRGSQTGVGQIAAGSNGLIKRASMNEHQWYGILSNLNHQINENLTVGGGVDIRFYHGSHYRKTIDLLGADYWFDQDNVNNMSDWVDLNGDGVASDDEYGNLVRPTNDADKLWGTVDTDERIDYYNDEDINWYGAFADAEYSNDMITVAVSGAFNYTHMRRIDFFNKAENENTTDWSSFIGGNVKAGASYRINSNHSLFANGGFISRAPYFDVLYPTFNNDELNEDAVNEKIIALEAGYGFRSRSLTLNVNGYFTQWQDKAEVQAFGNDRFLNLLGVDATHSGIEAEAWVDVTRNLQLMVFGSVGNWEWSNDPTGVVTDESNIPIDTVELFLNGLKVGDAAQTTFGIGGEYNFFSSMGVFANLFYFDNLYASYDPGDRDDPDQADRQPLELDSYWLLDVGARFNFTFAGLDSKLVANMNNALDEVYVAQAFDVGSEDETIRDTRGWYGLGRTWNLSLQITF